MTGVMKIARILVFAALAVGVLTAPLRAQEIGFEEAPIYHFPEIEPSYGLTGGYWLSGVKGSRRAAEYYYLEDSPSFGTSVIAFPFPHRLHFEIEFLNEKDYLSDLRYAYKDLVLLRAVARGLFHNLGGVTLIPGGDPVRINGAVFSPGDAVTSDPDESFGYRASLGAVSLRLKAPDYPAHAFVRTWYVDKEGDRQGRFLGGSAFFTDIERVSERSEVDRLTTDVEAGVNSHLGPVEAQYSHSEMRFSNDAGISGFQYTAAPLRAAGTYPRNVVPELEGSTDTVKVHTSYTGRLVASATFSAGDMDNETSSASADYYLASGEVVWTPASKFTSALRYRYEKRDVKNPDSLTDDYLGFPDADFASITGIRDSISADINTLSLTARYRPTSRVTVGADASHRRTDRENAGAWGIEDSTDETALGASLRLRLSSKLRLKARYRYKEYDDPAYNTQADDSHSGDLSVTWIPLSRVVVFAGYGLTRESRDHLHLLVEGIDVGAEDRRVSRDRVTAVVTFVLREDLSLTGSYGYWKSKVEQDLAYGNAGDPLSPFLDPGVDYGDNTWNYSASVDYSPLEQLDLHAGVSFTEAKAGFDPGIAPALQPVSLGSLSKLRLRETAYDLEARYGFPEDLDLGFRFEYRDLDEEIENQQNPEIQDGTAQVYMVTLSKRW
ncbi:MAG: TonB-dependent receptor [Nitrospirota bacterium]|jgi:hypothetical protein